MGLDVNEKRTNFHMVSQVYNDSEILKLVTCISEIMEDCNFLCKIPTTKIELRQEIKKKELQIQMKYITRLSLY
jgi:hypothetical protein